MKKLVFLLFGAIFFCAVTTATIRAQETANPAQSKQAAPQFVEWSDGFSGEKLDETKWEKFTFEGASGGKLEVKDGEVRIRSTAGTRAGIRTKDAFSSDIFAVEARIAKVNAGLPEQGSDKLPLGFGTLTILFDGSGRNRIEWILTSEGTFQAWSVIDGRGERLDNKKLGTKMKNLVLMIVRKGDEFSFYINDPKGKPQDAQLGLKTTIKNLPKSFRVMLYGYGTSENNWDEVRITAPKSN